MLVRPVAAALAPAASCARSSHFGGPASGAGLLHVAITNVDYTILAARLSAAQVGFYWRAFQIGVVYQDKISGIMMRLAFPIYSRTRDLDRAAPPARARDARARRGRGAAPGRR